MPKTYAEAIANSFGAVWDELKQIPGAIGEAARQRAEMPIGERLKEAAAYAVGGPLAGPVKGLYDIASQYVDASPEQRQEILNRTAQGAGGMIGGIGGLALTSETGGWGSVPGAMAGGAVGRGGAELLGPYFGASGPREGRTGPDVLEDYGTAALREGTYEGLGGAATAGAKTLGRGAANLAKRPFQPSAQHAALNDWAAQQTLPDGTSLLDNMPTWAMTDNPAGEAGAALLGYLPTSSTQYRAANSRALGATEDLWNDMARRAAPEAASATPENVIEAMQRAVRGRQGEFRGNMAKIASEIPNVPPSAGGAAMRTGREAALGSLSDIGEEVYGPIMSQYGDTPVDLTKLGAAARDIINTEEARNAMRQMLPGDAVGLLDSAGALRPTEVATGLVDQAGAPVTRTVPPTATLRQLKNARSEILKRADRLSREGGFSAAQTKRLAGLLGDAMSESGLPPDALEALRNADQVYRSGAETVRAARGKGLEGNTAANMLDRSIPDDQRLISAAGGTPDAIADVQAGITPMAVEGQGVRGVPGKDVGNFNAAAARQSFLTDESPTRTAAIMQKRPGVAEQLGYGDTLLRYGSPENVASEGELFGGLYGKTLMNDAIPEQGRLGSLTRTGPVFQRSAELADDGGNLLRRGYLEDLLSRSMKQDRQLDVASRVPDPRRLGEAINKSPGSFEVGAGPMASDLRNTQQMMSSITSPEVLYGNPSGSARGFLWVKTLGDVGKGAQKLIAPAAFGGAATGMLGGIPAVAGTAAVLGVPYAAAKALANPKVGKALTSPLLKHSAAIGPGATTAANMMRVPMMTQKPPRPELEFDPSIFQAQPQQLEFDPALFQ